MRFLANLFRKRALASQLRDRLRQLPIVAKALSYRENDYPDSMTCWTDQISLHEAAEFLLQRADMEGWRVGDPAGWKDNVETTYYVRAWQRYFRVWRVSETTYIGCHNLFEDPS